MHVRGARSKLDVMLVAVFLESVVHELIVRTNGPNLHRRVCLKMSDESDNLFGSLLDNRKTPPVLAVLARKDDSLCFTVLRRREESSSSIEGEVSAVTLALVGSRRMCLLLVGALHVGVNAVSAFSEESPRMK